MRQPNYKLKSAITLAYLGYTAYFLSFFIPTPKGPSGWLFGFHYTLLSMIQFFCVAASVFEGDFLGPLTKMSPHDYWQTIIMSLLWITNIPVILSFVEFVTTKNKGTLSLSYTRVLLLCSITNCYAVTFPHTGSLLNGLPLQYYIWTASFMMILISRYLLIRKVFK